MSQMTEHTKELVKAIGEHEPVTVRELEALGVRADIRSGIKNLQTHLHVTGVKHGKSATEYSLTRRGRLLLESFTARMGKVAEPRPSIVGGPAFVPKPMRCTRPQDEPAPSMENGERVGWKRPLIIGARVAAVGIHGGRF